jgi:putative FmdB family regulatory protein
VPLYEYQCAKDGTFERMQKFSDPPLQVCPTCGGPVEKLLSAPAIQFKGTGWYITDYARKSTGGGESGAEKAKTSEAKEAKAAGGSSAAPSTGGGADTSSASGKSEKK